MKRKRKKNDQKNFKKGGVDAKEIKNYKEKKQRPMNIIIIIDLCVI